MKKIIYRKLAQDYTSFFLLILFTISIIIWVLQAVNFLDFVTEDGHGFLVYFNYTLLNFPKILSRIFPFAVFLAFTYIILKYENKNELVIFWNFGVKKIDFINFFIKFSFGFVLISILLNALIAPYMQDKARSFIRSSDLDFFESILKPKKFIDIIENLTIYFEERDESGKFNNIFLNDKENKSSQITFAKRGKIEIRDNKKVLVLKIILVSILALVAILSFPILITKGNTHFKHALEWNYFLGVITFYLLTFFLWKKKLN